MIIPLPFHKTKLILISNIFYILKKTVNVINIAGLSFSLQYKIQTAKPTENIGKQKKLAP